MLLAISGANRDWKARRRYSRLRWRQRREASSDDAHVVLGYYLIGVREARSDALRENLSCLSVQLRHLHTLVHASPSFLE